MISDSGILASALATAAGIWQTARSVLDSAASASAAAAETCSNLGRLAAVGKQCVCECAPCLSATADCPVVTAEAIAICFTAAVLSFAAGRLSACRTSFTDSEDRSEPAASVPEQPVAASSRGKRPSGPLGAYAVPIRDI